MELISLAYSGSSKLNYFESQDFQNKQNLKRRLQELGMKVDGEVDDKTYRIEFSGNEELLTKGFEIVFASCGIKGLGAEKSLSILFVFISPSLALLKSYFFANLSHSKSNTTGMPKRNPSWRSIYKSIDLSDTSIII